MTTPKIGLLPFYVELYDKAVPQSRPRFEAFLETIASELESLDIEIIRAPVCRLKDEFAAAVALFEDHNVDAIVTLHLAYSPSLESAEVLASTKLPLIILDTTMTYDFGPDQDPDEIFYNHGIHGVQDFCNLLVRYGKAFHIEAGHWKESNVLLRVAEWVKAAAMARMLHNARVGIIGNPFDGMGDFHVPWNVLKNTIGMEVIHFQKNVSLSNRARDDEAILAEIAENEVRFDLSVIDAQKHRMTVEACLTVRQWIETERLTAFTLNFLDINRALGFQTVPFLEAGKAMAHGIGYAGEGDVLAAALVGMLLSFYPDTTFTEMFCPDWKNSAILLSHMGEMNINLVSGRAVALELVFPYGDVANPVIVTGRYRGGKVTLVNLAPGADDTYSLIIASGEMLGVAGEDRMKNVVHGWFRPDREVSNFLAAFSRAGGTHHSAIVYGDYVPEMVKFGEIMGWHVYMIQ